MTDYRVQLEIDVQADSPKDAAEKARRLAVNEESKATVFTVFGRIAECGGIDDGPIFERIADFDVRSNPSHPFYQALEIDEADDYDETIECAACGERVDVVDIFTVGHNETARDLGVNLGDTVCRDCMGEQPG